jgi:hypothetical protein
VLCAGIDDAGRVVSSANPDSPHATWRVTTVPGLTDAYQWGIACIRRPLCVAFDRSYSSSGGHYQSQQAFASIHPTRGSTTWRPMKAPGYFVGTLPNATETSCPWKAICLTWRKVAGAPTAVIVTERKRGGHGHTQSYLPIYGGTSCPSASSHARWRKMEDHPSERRRKPDRTRLPIHAPVCRARRCWRCRDDDHAHRKYVSLDGSVTRSLSGHYVARVPVSAHLCDRRRRWERAPRDGATIMADRPCKIRVLLVSR